MSYNLKIEIRGHKVKVQKNKKTQSRVCIACDGKKFNPYGKQLVECMNSNCGLIVAKHIPTFDELKRLYEEEYFFGMEYSDYKADRPALEKNFKQRIKHLTKYLHNDAIVVEVGCAYGYFLNMVKEQVKWHKGFDVSKEGIEFAKRELLINAHDDDFLEDKEIKKGSVDLVCMWDVMEHFGEPQKHVEKAAQLLKKGGALSFTTGDIGAFAARKRGEDWRMIHPPTHVYYFTTKSAKLLLEKYGLRVVSIRHKPTYRNAGSVFQQLIINRKVKNRSSFVLEKGYAVAKLTKLDRVNFPLNLFDVMEVTAVKD